MKRVIYYFISLILFMAMAVGEMQAQNVNAPVPAQESKRIKKGKEKPERPLVKKRPIPVKNIRTAGNWIDFAVAFDENMGSSISNPIEISTPEQLAYLAKQVNAGNNYAGKHFKLVADIRLNGIEWTPIGQFGIDYDDNSLRFCGSLYGDGHKIENLTITKGGDYSGLFGACGKGSYIEKLHVTDCYVMGKMMVGGLVGELINGSVSECSVSGNVLASNECVGGIAGANNGTIVNSQSSVEVYGNSNDTGGLAGVNGDRMTGVVDNCQATGPVIGYWNVGGMVGRNDGVISNSHALGDVSGEEWIGGLVGWTEKGMITSCRASGNVKGFFDVGGLVGFNGYQKSTVQISNSHATGKVAGVGSGNSCIGGLAGYSGGVVFDCYAVGTVDGGESVGGLIGENGGKITNSHAIGNVNGILDTGGLIGNNGYPGTQAHLENCYASGTVIGATNNSFAIGGLVGYSGGTIARCYATGSITGGDNVGGLAGEQEGSITNCYASGTVTAKMTAGGLTGWNWAKILNCYATGLVNSDGNAGGFIGQNQSSDAVVRNCYFDWQTTKYMKGIGVNNYERSSLARPMSSETFKNGKLPEGFDANLWQAVAGQYPRLKK